MDVWQLFLHGLLDQRIVEEVGRQRTHQKGLRLIIWGLIRSQDAGKIESGGNLSSVEWGIVPLLLCQMMRHADARTMY